ILTSLFGLLASWLSVSGAIVTATDSLSRTIAEAQQGDTILVQGPATFHEHVVITKAIRLLGTNAPVIDADGSGTPLTLSAPGIVVSGLAIRNSGRDLAAFTAGVMITAPDVTVRNCRIQNDAFGIYLRGVDDCVISGNEIVGSGQVPSAARGNGIHLWKAQRNQILQNQISDKRDGMYFSYADNNLIAGNQVANNRFGIHYMY